MFDRSAGGIFGRDQERAAGRIVNTVKAHDDVTAKKAPARKGCLWAGTRCVAALTRCDGIALRTAPGGLPRPKRNGTDQSSSHYALVRDSAIEQRHALVPHRDDENRAGDETADMRPPGDLTAHAEPTVEQLQAEPEGEDQISR